MIRQTKKAIILVLLYIAIVCITLHSDSKKSLIWSSQGLPNGSSTPIISALFPALSEPVKRNFTVADAVIGTAFSSNHFAEALRSCISIKNHPSMIDLVYNGTIKVIAYNMGGLNETELNLYANHCPFVKVQTLDYSMYPEFVSDLMQYRWKPLVIAKLMEVRPVVFYLDSSVVFVNHSSTSFEDIITSMNQNYSKCGIRAPRRTFHSIISATHPGIYNYFEKDCLKYVKRTKMVAATTYLAVRSAAGIRVMKKLVMCALTKECMAPTGATAKCDVARLNFFKYAECHRYDQSALSLALLECSHFQGDYVGNTDLIDIQRRHNVIQFWTGNFSNDERGQMKFDLGEIKDFYLSRTQDD